MNKTISLNIFDSIILATSSGLNYSLGIKKSPGTEISNVHRVIFIPLMKGALPQPEEFISVGP